ncbi:arsenic resistance N-acetyltransferase ArsN2 [Thermoflexibacter ruber]|uniref:Amino-acid N-acetyltransferase n=1 Tax=Thermoflexibacter ruber TaxID=1003 RepID=A0A1I2I171_9BACT|nr:arsenic resistance N-acetyltransferase ArsN2 [Thermoflexibacter ruber]SFF34656.1 amino-acid N-acetyltransferase [Thermoflexibacter ruber]
MQENKYHSESQDLTFQRVTSEEAKKVFVAQLIEAQLPYADLGEATELFVLLDAENKVIGTAGLEWYGQNILLRSVSVSKCSQGKGIGKQILLETEGIARSRQAKGIYLLTETAKDFFEKNNYVITPRQSIPQEVLTSPQFTSTCPSTATAMVKMLI